MTTMLIRMFIKDHANTTDLNVRTQYGTLASIVGIIVNLLLSAAKFLIGTLGHSLAVTADAVNNLSDAAANIVTLVTVRMANKPIDPDHPFGHGRMEYLGSLFVGALVLMMGFTLLKDSIASIISPSAPDFSVVAVIVLVISILGKFWLFLFYRKMGKTIDNSTLLAASKDSISDVMSTAAVLVSVVLSLAFGWAIDGWIGLLVSLIVLKAGFGICKETIDNLLGGRPDPEKVRQIKEMMLSYDPILGVHDLILHDYGPGRCYASAHAEVPADGDIVYIHEIIDKAEHDIGHTLKMPICIHMDPIVTDDDLTTRLRQLFSDFVAKENLSLHDFRMTPGENHMNLIFDVAVPAGYKDTKKLLESLREFAASQGNYSVVVQIDIDYTL